MNAFFNSAHAAMKSKVDVRDGLIGHPGWSIKIYHIPISKFRKNGEFLRKIVEIRHGTRIASVSFPLV
jgi:hypothetical protein